MGPRTFSYELVAVVARHHVVFATRQQQHRAGDASQVVIDVGDTLKEGLRGRQRRRVIGGLEHAVLLDVRADRLVALHTRGQQRVEALDDFRGRYFDHWVDEDASGEVIVALGQVGGERPAHGESYNRHSLAVRGEIVKGCFRALGPVGPRGGHHVLHTRAVTG